MEVQALINEFSRFEEITKTENGANTWKSTKNAVLDLFSHIGGLRENLFRIDELVSNAFAEDKNLTAKCIFYARDCRGGLGERDVFRLSMKKLIELDPKAKNLISLIPEYGRWDDVIFLFDVAEKEVVTLIKEQLEKDLKSGHPSLLAKWMPSENTSSKRTCMMATKLREALGYSPKKYRKVLSTLREKIRVVERDMSSKNWGKINYETVPSYAMKKYRNAFLRNDNERFSCFLKKVSEGKAKINANVLFPHDLVRVYLQKQEVDLVIEEQWKELPDYFNGKYENSIVVADTSGSMYPSAIAISISLAIYAAERNKGIWKDRFITFSEIPVLETISGKTLFEKVNNLRKANWGYNTDIKSVFNVILEAAKRNGLDPTQMVERIYIISDMEFDNACGVTSTTLFEKIRKEYESSGYKLPELVFWNVNARNANFPMRMDERGFINVSGRSPSVFEKVLKNEFIDPVSFMKNVLEDKRYSQVKLN